MSEGEETNIIRMRTKVRTPQIDQGWVYAILGIKEPLGFLPRSSHHCYSPLNRMDK
jgi:hypothetical protein